MKKILRLCIPILLTIFFMFPLSAKALTANEINSLPYTQDKKIIDFEWSAPSAGFVAGHIGAMQKKPFDGVVFFPGNRLLQFFDPSPWAKDTQSIDAQSLSKIKWGKWKGNNFLLLWTSDLWNLNYWDDATWQSIAQNMAAVAKAAKDYGCAGILLDTETYSDRCPWNYATQSNGHTVTETRQKVRQRGQEVMTALEQAYPKITVLATFLLGHTSESYDLLPYFANGLLDKLSGTAKLVESCEESYSWSITEHWYWSYNSYKTDLADVPGYLDPTNRLKWRNRVQAARAVYLDGIIGKKASQAEALRFAHNVYTGLQTADTYVWVYSERTNWFGVPVQDQPMGNDAPITGVPKSILNGLKDAQYLFKTNRRLGYDMYSNDLWSGATVDRSINVKINAAKKTYIHGKTGSVSVKLQTNCKKVLKSEVYINAVKVATLKPGKTTATLSGLQPGTYRLIVRVTARNQRTGTSNPIQIKIIKK